MFRRNVLILRREEQDLSTVTLLTGKMKYARSTLLTSPSMPLQMALWLKVSTKVMGVGYPFMVTDSEVSSWADLMVSGSMSN